MTTSSTTTPKSRKNVDINVSANRFSFVSDDQKPLNNFSVSGNSSVVIGEAEVITIPSSGVGVGVADYAAVQDVTSERTKVKHAGINIVDEVLSRNNGKLAGESNERKISRHEIDASINDSENLKPITDNAANFSVNVPMRSNIALNKPRPKPVLAKTDNQTVTNATKDEIKSLQTASAAPASAEIDQTTEDGGVIVLNTEVVTSTSMQVSYGNNVLLEETQQPKSDEAGSDNITHIVRSPVELNGGSIKTTQQKYKTIFPRSIREEDNQSDPTKVPKFSTHLSLIIEKYKKQPSNETLHLIIEQLSAMYTKTTTPAAQTTKLNVLKPSYNGIMLNKPLHKVYNATTTTPTPSTLEPRKY